MSASVDGARGGNDEHASGMSFPPPAHQAIFGVATMRRSPDIYISQDYEGVGVCQESRWPRLRHESTECTCSPID